jgi:hypothetical protein
MTGIVCHRNSGVKTGVVTAPGFYLHGLAGAAFLNHDLNVNLATIAQSNVTTPGFTAGIGGEYLRRAASASTQAARVRRFAVYAKVGAVGCGG